MKSKKLPVKKTIELPVKNLKSLFSREAEFFWLGQSGFIFSAVPAAHPVPDDDPEKEKNCIVGNMSFEEGMVLSAMLDTPMLGTHFGMFGFNTVDPGALRENIRNFRLENQIDLTELAVLYSLK